MKKLIRVLLFLVPVFGISLQEVRSQVSSSAQISAQIVTPINASQDNSLSFGFFHSGNRGGSISVSPEGTAQGEIKSEGVINPASFKISGEKNASFSVNLPKGTTILTNPEHGGTVMVSGWSTSSDLDTTGIQLAGGSRTISIGATLKVGAVNESPAGVYVGTYQVTFDYN